MGNLALLRVIDRIAARASANLGIRFGQIFLAAPDVDRDLFLKLATAYPKLAERTTLYVSPKDQAIRVARWLSDASRVGLTPPRTIVDQIDTIEVSADLFDRLFSLNHSYFANAEPLLYDMFYLLRSNAVPAMRRAWSRTRNTGRLGGCLPDNVGQPRPLQCARKHTLVHVAVSCLFGRWSSSANDTQPYMLIISEECRRCQSQ